MARLHVKGLQWLEPPAAYAHGSMKESVFYGCFLVAFIETYDSQHVAPPTRRSQCASPGACHLTTWKPHYLQMLPAFQVFFAYVSQCGWPWYSSVLSTKNFAADPRAFHCIRCKEPWFFHGNMSRLYVKLGAVLHDAN